MIGILQNHPTVRPRFQFTIRLLFVTTAVLAVLIALVVAMYRARVANRRAMLFFQAIQNGNLLDVDRLLKTHPQLAHGRQHGNTSSSLTPLQMALGRPEVFGRILEENPDLEETSSSGETALHIAVRQQMPSVVQRLIRLGADTNAVDDNGITPLHVAVEYDRTNQLTKLLLDGGANPNPVSPANPNSSWLDGKSPLHRAAERGNDVAVMQLFNAGADVNSRDLKGRTALHFAVEENHHKAAALLMEHGADLTARDGDWRIPGERGDGSNSEIAALIWWEQITKLYDPNENAKLDKMLDAAPQALSFRTEYTPETVLNRALFAKRLDLLDYLLGRVPHGILRGMEGQTPLHDACAYATPVAFAKKLIDAGADIHAQDSFGHTPLHWAAREHNHDVLGLLLSRGAKIEALDNAGTNVLDTTFERSFSEPTGPETLDLLRKAGHPPTALYAAATGDLPFLQNSARDDPGSLDRVYTRTGVRPLHAAVLNRQPRIIEWLCEQGVEREPLKRPDWRAKWKDAPLMVALSHDLVDIAILLINRGADVNRKSSTGYYPAHAVIEWGRDPKILEALLLHGADPTLRYEDRTVLDFALVSKSKHRGRYLELLKSDGNGR